MISIYYADEMEVVCNKCKHTIQSKVDLTNRVYLRCGVCGNNIPLKKLRKVKEETIVLMM